MKVDSMFKPMDVKVTWKIEVLSAVDSKSSKSMDVTGGQITKITWRIDNFSKIKEQRLYSENFSFDYCKWRILFSLEGTKMLNHLAIYLNHADPLNLLYGWSKRVQYGFAIIDQIDRKSSCIEVAVNEFKQMTTSLGFPRLLPLSELHNPKRGYLVDDACLVEAYVSTHWIDGLISKELIVDTDSDNKRKIKETDRVKATEHVEANETVAIEHEEPTEQDIKSFFTSLESAVMSINIGSSQYEAKKAMIKLDEAFNMTPVNFYDSDKLSQLKQAFKILASLDCSSTSLKIEEKNELVAMEERLKELADRATKALEDQHHLTEKESMKLTIVRNLDRNLIKYKEVEQKLVSLLAERSGVFKSSKEMKMELEALQKECAEYEAKAKIAEEEAKIVEAEWGKMKHFIASIKGKI